MTETIGDCSRTAATTSASWRPTRPARRASANRTFTTNRLPTAVTLHARGAAHAVGRGRRGLRPGLRHGRQRHPGRPRAPGLPVRRPVLRRSARRAGARRPRRALPLLRPVAVLGHAPARAHAHRRRGRQRARDRERRAAGRDRGPPRRPRTRRVRIRGVGAAGRAERPRRAAAPQTRRGSWAFVRGADARHRARHDRSRYAFEVASAARPAPTACA